MVAIEEFLKLMQKVEYLETELLILREENKKLRKKLGLSTKKYSKEKILNALKEKN